MDDVHDNVEDEENDEDGDDLFDSVCAICDNGSELLWYIFLVSYRSFFSFWIFSVQFSHPVCFLLRVMHAWVIKTCE